MVFPELCLSAYAIDDLLFQDALLDAVERQIDRLIDASRELFAGLRRRRAAALAGAALQLRAWSIHRGRLLGVVPKIYPAELPRILRAAAFHLGRGDARPVDRRWPGTRRRSASICCSRATGHGRRSPSMSRSARICGCRSRRAPMRRCGRGRDPAQPVGQQHHDRQGGDAPPAVRVAIVALHRRLCLFGRRRRRVDDRPRLGRPGRHLRDRRPARRDRALLRRSRDGGRRCRSRPHPPGADAHQHLRRQCAADRGAARRRSAASRSRSPRPKSALELRRAVERFPYVPADPAMLRDNCYEAYNIQVQGLAQRLKATGLKKLVIGVSGGLDSTQALIVAARVMDRLGPAAHQRAGLYAARLRDQRDDQGQCLAADEGARRHRRGDRHPAGGATRCSRISAMRSSRGEAALRRDLRECAGRAAHRLSVPAGQPQWRAGGRHRRPVRARRSAGAPTASAIRCRITTPMPRSPRR